MFQKKEKKRKEKDIQYSLAQAECALNAVELVSIVNPCIILAISRSKQ